MSLQPPSTKERKDSSSSVELATPPQLDIIPATAVKILFLSIDPVHEDHDEDPDSSEFNDCFTCRLISKYAAGFNRRKLKAVKSEIEKKIMRLSSIETSRRQGLSFLGRNLDSIKSQLPKEHEALMTFCEVLSIMNVKIPESLKEKRDMILMINQIPARNNKRDSITKAEVVAEEKNHFFAYTTNKILAELGDSLTVEHVYALRRVIIKEGTQDSVFSPRLVEAMTNLNVVEEDPKFKDLLFYYIILNLRRYGFHHGLKKLIEDSKPNGIDDKQEMILSKSLKQLDRYHMTAKPPGICIIFAMQEGMVEGMNCDVKNLKDLFEGFFYYDVYVKSDPTKEDIKAYATELGSGRYMFYDSLIVIFLGYGNKSNLVVKNGEFIHKRDEFIARFVNISWLQEKPKMFFILDCSSRNNQKKAKPLRSAEGGEGGLGVETDSIAYGLSIDPSWNNSYSNYCDGEMINSLADTLISYATLWYEKTSSDTKGSLYINTLIETLRESGQKKSIEENLRQIHFKVNTVGLKKRVRHSSQTEVYKKSPYFESGLEKEFIFPEEK